MCYLVMDTIVDACDHDVLHLGTRLREYFLALWIHSSRGEGKHTVHVRGGDAAAQSRAHCTAVAKVFWVRSSGQTLANGDGVTVYDYA